MSKVSMDFETYSSAGYEWNETTNKWDNNGGISKVGASAYSEHPSTEALCLAYQMGDKVVKLWEPTDPPPMDLFAHIMQGGVIHARNSLFEFFIWDNVCHERMGWPALPIEQLMDDQAESLAWGMPASLAKCGVAMGMPLKEEDGKRLIRKFSIPHNPTKNNPSRRTLMTDDIMDAFNMYHYCKMDVIAEDAISAATPELSPFEREVFLLDQSINSKGCQIDTESLDNCIAIVDQAMEKYTEECMELTGGIKPSETAKLKAWLNSKGVGVADVTKGTLSALLDGDAPLLPDVRRVIEIRLSIGAASVKKLYSIKQRVSRDGRIRGMFQYCGASNTGRFAGRGPQPQNLPNSGPTKKWGITDVENVYRLAKPRSLGVLEDEYGDAVSAIAGSLRGLFCAAPGYDLICSDYSAIEARVIAFMAGEEWRMGVFRTHGMVYEMSASKIIDEPFDSFVEYYQTHEDHHPRRKLGKVAELASAYGGGLDAWLQFGAGAFMTDKEIQTAITKWRKESPKIVAYWATLEKDAIGAIKFPGRRFGMYEVQGDVLYCNLPSGRRLNYHTPRIIKETKWYYKCPESGKGTVVKDTKGRSTVTVNKCKKCGKKHGVLPLLSFDVDVLSFMATHATTKQWCLHTTWGGRLVENVIQAVSRDILVWAMVQLHKAGYPTVIHVHDEVVAEVPEGTGSVEEVERIMAEMPPWCADWPITASDGWRGKRYRK